MSGTATERAGAARRAAAVHPPLTVVVVNWNGRDDLDACLRSLEAGGYGSSLRVMVVDNGSRDGSADHVRAHFPQVELIASPDNLRWAGGNNLALRRLRDEGGLRGGWALLLNNDTEVPPGALQTLVAAAAAEPRAWAATPRICYAARPDLLWYDGGEVGAWSGWIRHAGIRRPAAGRPLTPRFVGYGTGCALLVGERALREVGLLDESYHLYGEDTDWCLRLRAAGGQILHVPEAVILHRVSASLGAVSPRKLYLRSRSHVRLLRRHWPPRRRPVLLPAQVGLFLGNAAWHLWHGRPESARALVRGALDELRHAPLPEI
ncbi:MAG: glycosyltransferase family 2 protein [Candidatus Krumholzibacteriia bacterium]